MRGSNVFESCRQTLDGLCKSIYGQISSPCWVANQWFNAQWTVWSGCLKNKLASLKIKKMVWCDQHQNKFFFCHGLDYSFQGSPTLCILLLFLTLHQFKQFKDATLIAAADSEEEKADDGTILCIDPFVMPSWHLSDLDAVASNRMWREKWIDFCGQG